jgi:hypothetical protein
MPIGASGTDIRMDDLQTRLEELYASLAEFDTDQAAPSSVGTVFNALLEEAKAEKPADPVVTALQPVPISSASEFADITCGALRTVIQQVLTAVSG